MRNNFDFWIWFLNNNQEELFYMLSSMIEITLKEMLPQMIDEQLRQKIDGLSFSIQTSINGKQNATLKDTITEMILNELQK